jgi:SAM-dependent methyltransferase
MLNYIFKDISKCNMCQSSTQKHIVLGKRLNSSQGLSPWKKLGITTTIAQCSNCGLIYPNPQPIPNSLSDHYDLPPDEYWSDQYLTNTHDSFGSEIEVSKRLLRFRPGMRALDIGAGVGKCMLALQRAEYDAFGIEPSPSFHQHAIQKLGIDSERLQLVSIEDADFPREHFEFITFGAVLEHLFDPSDALARALVWLKPNGVIHAEVPSSKWLTARLVNWYYRLRGSDFVGNLSPMHPPFHNFEFNIKSFQLNGQELGYRVEESRIFICKTYLPTLIEPIARQVMKYTGTGMQLSVWLRKSSSQN